MFCPTCGNSLASGARFCGKCGQPTVGGDNPLNAVQQEKNLAPNIPAMANAAHGAEAAAGHTVHNVKNAKIIGVVITLAIVAAGVILFNMFFLVKPSDTVEKFIQAINEKDVDTAMSCMDPAYEKTYQAGSSLLSGLLGVEISDLAELIPGMVEIMHASGDSTDLKMEVIGIVSEDVSGNDAIVIVKIRGTSTDSSGHEKTEEGNSTFKLQKFNDGWRIVEFE